MSAAAAGADTMTDEATTTISAAAAAAPAAAAAADDHTEQSAALPVGRGHRQRKAKVMDDAAPVARPQRSRASRATSGVLASAAPSAEAAAVEDAEDSPAAAPLADDSAKEREVVPIEHYGLEVDRILAWRYKNSAVVHRTADGTIATGGDVRAPFEGQEQHLHIHPVPTASSKKGAAAAAAAASSAASTVSAPAPPASAAAAAPAARETSGRAQSAAAAKKAAREAAIEAKAQAKAAKAAAKEAAAAGKRGRKRKKDDEPAEVPEPPVAAAAPPAVAPAAAGAVAPEKGKGRRPKFTPLSKEDALAAFQRTLSAARESAGLASQPVTGLYASKKERLANREAAELAAERREEEEAEREAESSDEEEVEADADAASSDDSESGEGSDEEEEGDEDDEGADSDAEGDDEDGRPSKRRRTVSAKAAASSAAGGGKRSKSKSKKAKEAAKKKSRHAGRPSTTAVRNALIAENNDKEFFVTLKGRSYLHAKWVDVYAFLQPPSSRVHEMASRPTTALLSIGLPTEGAEKEAAGAGGDKQTSGTYTQLRIKLQRFLRSTPLPIPDDEELFLADFVEIDRILARKLVEVEESESDGEGDATATSARARGSKAQRRSNKSQRMEVDEAASAASSRSASPVPAAASAAAASSSTPRSRAARSSPTSAVSSSPSPSPRSKLTLATFYLVKWQGLPYSASTWEHSRYVHDDSKVREFELRQRVPGPDRPELLGASATQPRPPPSAWLSTRAKMSAPDHLPIFKNGNQLRPWQIDGVNFLNYNWYQRKGCILADEMGLGKTVQVCAHILHMRSAFARGPFLVIVPLSTLPHWKREFDTWSDLNAITLQGSKADRDVVRTFEWNFWANEGRDFDGRTVRVGEEYKFDVLVCTYESILAETNMLAKVPWRAIIVDEAHRLKNAESRLFKALALFQSEHRLLMTGTPIQNNLDELWTLLNFIEPATFPSLPAFQQQYGVLEKSAQVTALQSSLSPFLLRRMKEDCAKNIPAKEETIIYCELTILQKTYYRAVYERNRAFLYKGCKTGNVPHLLNVVMQLRKVCSHPFLLPGVEDKETGGATSSEEFLKALIAASGKLVLLDKLLAKLKRTGHRVLIFSQMKMILDLLEYYMKLKNYLYERIDGSIRGNDRQAAIDRFSAPGSDRFVFMLSTRAGGLGINLTAADTVIIYDSDFNPQNDEQAQARCHRIGQDKPVQVYRLVARGTYEMDMFRRASRKLGLDQAVLKKSGLDKSSLEREGEGADSSSNALSKLDKAEVESLLRNGAMQLLDDPEAEAASASFCEADIDEILTSRTTVIRSGGNDDPNAPREASTFSQAVFASEQSDAKIDVNDKDFWQKLLPDESSANKLMEKLSDGSAYSSKDARAQFLAHLQDHVREISNAYQQGESLQHVPLIIEILKVVSSATPPPYGSAAAAAAAGSAAEAAASTAAAAAPPAPTPMDVGEEGASAAAASGPSTATHAGAFVPGWTREQIRQCSEWLQELSKPRRQRKVADRYTDLGMNGPLGSGGGVSGVQAIESAFKRRLYGRALNGMGGIVLTRKQRKSMAMTLLDMAGVLPFPKGVAPAAASAAADDAASTPASAAAAPLPPPTLDEQMAVWYMLRAQLDSSLRDRRLSELMGWMLSFVQLLISLSDAQDQPVFAGVLARLQACVPAPEQLAALEAAESKARRCRERHNAIKIILAQQYRQRIAAARKESNREAAAAAAQSAEPVDGEAAPSADAPVKLEGGADASSSAAPSPAPLDDSLVVDGGSSMKLEGTSIGSLLETDIGTIRIDDLLREEGAGNTYTSSGKRIGRPTSLLTDDTATLIQFQPLAIRGNAPDVSPDHLQDEYNDAQEQAESREEVAHYARYELSPLKVSFAHFPSLAEDLTFVKYLCKRTKRWARFMLLAQQLRDELDEFQQCVKAEDKERAHVLEVVHRYVSDEQLQARDEPAVEDEEVAVIEGALAHAEKTAAADKATTQDGAAAMEVDATAAAAPADAAVAVTGSAAAASTSSEFAALTAAQRKLLTHLGRAAVGEVRALPSSLLARLLRRTVVRTPPSAALLAQQGPLFAQLHIPTPLERLPAWWWTSADDKALLQGVARYGVAFNKIARAADLGFKLKLADTAFGDDEEGSEEDEPERGGSPTKARGKAAAAAAAADRKPTLAIKEEEAESAAAAAADSSATAAAGSTSTSVHAAGNGCICRLARYARNMGRTRVCTSCNYWFHLSCLDDPARLKLANFLPLPAGHPLAPGLGSVAGPPGFETATVKAEGPDALARQRSMDSSAGDELVAVSAPRKAKTEADDEDDSDSGTDDEEESKPKARRGSTKASTAAVHAPSASALRDSGGFRCPRCCMAFPGQRALELRLRVLADALCRSRRSRVKSRDKLLRALDEQHHRAADSAAAPTSRARASGAESSSAASSSSAAALALWTKKERHEFQRSLQMYGSAFFLKGGYHAGVPVLEEAVRGAVAGSSGGSAALAHLAATPLLSRKTPASLRAYYERLMAQCQYLVERHRRDTTISALRRRQTALLAEHRELAEARGRLASLIQKERQSQAKYCFCKAAGPLLRAAAAAQTRKKRPDEFLVGCDDGSSPGCRASGGWFHGLCMGIPNEAAVPDQWICPHCDAQRAGTEPVLPALPAGDVTDAAAADSAPITLAEVPASFDPLPLSSLFESSTDSGAAAGGDDSGSESDAGPSSHGDSFNSLYSSLSLDDLEEEFNSRAELYTKDAATLRTEFASLKALVARPLPKAVVVDESLGHHLAYKILARVNLLQSLRDGLAKGADAVRAVLETIAAATQSAPAVTSASGAAARMPDWWHPPVHDWAILRAVFRHGLGSAEAILADPLFSDAWHPTLDEPYLHSLVSVSSGAKIALRREIDKFLPVFLQDRNPLLKRLATLGNWLNYGGPNNPNPAADLPFTAKRGKTGADIIAAAASASASGGDSGAAGAPAAKSGEKARAPRLPLVAILEAKLTGKLPSEDQLANPDQSSGAEEQEEGEEAETAAAARSAPKRAVRKKKVTGYYVPVTAGYGSEESKELAAARELAMSQSNEKRRRSSSKRKMDAEADAEAIQEIALAQRQQRAATAAPARKRKSAPVASAASDSEHSEAETDEAEPTARPKRKSAGKRKSATAAEETDEGADESAAAPKQRKRPSARKAAPASSEDDGAVLPAGNVRSVADVRRDPLTGAVLPFTVKGGIRIVALGRVVDSPLFRKGALAFPVGFTSTRPFHSVRHPGSRTEYTSRVLADPSSDAPLFEVRATDDPDTAYAGATASACWSAVAVAAHNARGTEGRTAVSGLEYFGLSHPVVKALVAEMEICAMPNAQTGEASGDSARAVTPVAAAAAAVSPAAPSAAVPLAATTLAVGGHPVAAALAHPSHLAAAYPAAHPGAAGPAYPAFHPPPSYDAMIAQMYSFMSQQQRHAAAQSQQQQQQQQQSAPHAAHIHAVYQQAAAAQLQQQRALQAATSPPAAATADAVAAAVAAASAAAADPNTMTDA